MTTERRGPSGRAIAAEVLVRVWRDEAFAAAALDSALARAHGLDPRERGLATELTYGVLRTAPFLEARLARLAPRGLDARRDAVRAHLLVAAYQILFFDRVPSFAAVDAAVGEIRRLRGAKVAGFANALLRGLARERQGGALLPKAAPSGEAPADRPTLDEAIVASTAPWLAQALERALGPAEARAFLAAPVPPPLGLRVRSGRDRDALAAELARLLPGATIALGRISPLAILVRGGGDVRTLEPLERGDVTLQEEGAQIVALALGARSSERVLDACAGRGNKAALLAETAEVDVADLHPAKLDRLCRELARWGVRPHATFAVDWTVGPGEVPEGYDRVLVDAPCSGIGTLRRRPDLAARGYREPLPALARHLPELVAAQRSILLRAASRARPGGRVVYAVCSVLREEGEEVVEAALAEAPWLAPAPFDSELVRGLAGDATHLRLLPSVHGTDGYFLASLERRA